MPGWCEASAAGVAAAAAAAAEPRVAPGPAGTHRCSSDRLLSAYRPVCVWRSGHGSPLAPPTRSPTPLARGHAPPPLARPHAPPRAPLQRGGEGRSSSRGPEARRHGQVGGGGGDGRRQSSPVLRGVRVLRDVTTARCASTRRECQVSSVCVCVCEVAVYKGVHHAVDYRDRLKDLHLCCT